jgi:hypothetical protein
MARVPFAATKEEALKRITFPTAQGNIATNN